MDFSYKLDLVSEITIMLFINIKLNLILLPCYLCYSKLLDLLKHCEFFEFFIIFNVKTLRTKTSLRAISKEFKK